MSPRAIVVLMEITFLTGVISCDSGLRLA